MYMTLNGAANYQNYQLPDVVSSRIGCCIMVCWMVEVASGLESKDVLAELLEIPNLDKHSLLLNQEYISIIAACLLAISS